MTQYTDAFFLERKEAACEAANVIIEVLFDLFKPNSVVDVGCATGTWLSVIREKGIDDILGIDGPWVDQNVLDIPREDFQVEDFEKPFTSQTGFDLVISLEVAEHLREEVAEHFVRSLVQLAPVVLFSAAIPHQGGTGHLNEQWQDYWMQLFDAHGYVPIDCIRPRIWDNQKIAVFYRQNILLYVKKTHLENVPGLKTEYEKGHAFPLSVVHPLCYLGAKKDPDPDTLSLKGLLSVFPGVFAKALKRRFGGAPKK